MARLLSGILARRKTVVLDGALGTLLEERGIPAGLPLWSANALITSPAAVGKLHEDYIRAGADIITTATFRTTRRMFNRAGLPDRSAELTKLAVSLAKDAREVQHHRGILIGGSMGPLEDCYRPDLVPPDDAIREEQTEHARRLAGAGVDVLLLETFGTIREVRIAAEAANSTGKEYVVSFLVNVHGTLYSGETIQGAVEAVRPFTPTVISVNCVSPRFMHAALEKLLEACKEHSLPTGAYANVGLPEQEHAAAFVHDVTPEEYLVFAEGWRSQGVRIIGGCCGTSPEYIELLARHFSGL
jgi:S-methylmethionine-dependent homocysteine/selenocysteine methylase